MRTLSLAIVFATTATLIACSGHDDPAPADQAPAAVVAPTDPAKPASGDTAVKTDEKSPTTTGTSAKTDDKKTTDAAKTTGTGAPAGGDQTADLAAAATKLNDCLKECKDADCAKACITDVQAGLPAAPELPAGGTAACCSAGAFFVCSSDDGAATCDANNPGPNCKPVPAMDAICTGK